MTTYLYVGEIGLETAVSCVLGAQEWEDAAQVPANHAWTRVRADVLPEYLEARNAWLRAVWTPNQDAQDRVAYARVMVDAEARIVALGDAVTPL